MFKSAEQIKDLLGETIRKIVSFMNIDCRVDFREENDEGGRMKTLVVSVQIDNDARFLIGKNGQNLKALENIVRTVFIKNTNRDEIEFENVVIDINDYRKSKAGVLTDIAKQAVTRVRNTQKAEALSPMSAYERRIVHVELSSYPDIVTESIGAEPQRRIVIKPYR
jgi:spoIIIJ-associated protein